MNENTQPKVTQYNSNTWIIDEGFVRMFLLTGTERALLIDSGMNTHNLRGIAAGLTELPLSLLNTHGDRDHIACNGEFDSFYMHPAECANYYGEFQGSGTLLPVEEGSVLELGGRTLRIIALPGHTPGSIAVLDEAARLLFAGDSVQDFMVFMFGSQRSLQGLALSLDKLDGRKDEFDTILASHGTLELPPDQPGVMAGYVREILAGKADFEPTERMGRTLKKYGFPRCSFLCE